MPFSSSESGSDSDVKSMASEGSESSQSLEEVVPAAAKATSSKATSASTMCSCGKPFVAEARFCAHCGKQRGQAAGAEAQRKKKRRIDSELDSDAESLRQALTKRMKEGRTRKPVKNDDEEDQAFELNMEALRGRWSHSSPGFGLFTVKKRTAHFRSGPVQITTDADGSLYCMGWKACTQRSCSDRIVWKRDGQFVVWTLEDDGEDQVTTAAVDTRNIIQGKRRRFESAGSPRPQRQTTLPLQPKKVQPERRIPKPPEQKRPQRQLQLPVQMVPMTSTTASPASSPSAGKPTSAGNKTTVKTTTTTTSTTTMKTTTTTAPAKMNVPKEVFAEAKAVFSQFKDKLLASRIPKCEEILARSRLQFSVPGRCTTQLSQQLLQKEMNRFGTSENLTVTHKPQHTFFAIDKIARSKFAELYPKLWNSPAEEGGGAATAAASAKASPTSSSPAAGAAAAAPSPPAPAASASPTALNGNVAGIRSACAPAASGRTPSEDNKQKATEDQVQLSDDNNEGKKGKKATATDNDNNNNNDEEEEDEVDDDEYVEPQNIVDDGSQASHSTGAEESSSSESSSSEDSDAEGAAKQESREEESKEKKEGCSAAASPTTTAGAAEQASEEATSRQAIAAKPLAELAHTTTNTGTTPSAPAPAADEEEATSFIDRAQQKSDDAALPSKDPGLIAADPQATTVAITVQTSQSGAPTTASPMEESPEAITVQTLQQGDTTTASTPTAAATNDLATSGGQSSSASPRLNGIPAAAATNSSNNGSNNSSNTNNNDNNNDNNSGSIANSNMPNSTKPVDETQLDSQDLGDDDDDFDNDFECLVAEDGQKIGGKAALTATSTTASSAVLAATTETTTTATMSATIATTMTTTTTIATSGHETQEAATFVAAEQEQQEATMTTTTATSGQERREATEQTKRASPRSSPSPELSRRKRFRASPTA